MAKSKYEKMEVLLEEIMNEPNLEQKIAEMEKNQTQPKTQVKDAEYYKQKRQNKRMSLDEYEKIKQKTEKESQEEEKRLEKKLTFYKAYKQNKDQIFNIREYELALQSRLENLEEELKGAQLLDKDNKAIKDHEEKYNKELEEISKNLNNVYGKLNSPNLSDDERIALEGEKSKLEKQRDENNDKYRKFLDIKKQVEGRNKNSKFRDLSEISKDITSTRVSISECNAIWSSLLKGKSWDDIEAILANGNFTAQKGTVQKIRTLDQDRNLSKANLMKIKPQKNQSKIQSNASEKDSNLPTVSKTSFKDRHPILGKIPFLGRIADKIIARREKKNAEKTEKQVDTSTKQYKDYDEKKLKYIDAHKDRVSYKDIAQKGFRESVRVDLEKRHQSNKQTAANNYAQQYGGRYTEQDGANNDKGREPED